MEGWSTLGIQDHSHPSRQPTGRLPPVYHNAPQPYCVCACVCIGVSARVCVYAWEYVGVLLIHLLSKRADLNMWHRLIHCIQVYFSQGSGFHLKQ